MSGRMRRDVSGRDLQGFAPSRFQSVTADTAWTPGGDDRAFSVSSAIGYKINSESTYVTLQAGAVRVIANTVDTITFDADAVIEVM